VSSSAAATLHAAIVREPASVQHVPALAGLTDRLDGRLRPEAYERCRARGSALDLNDAATYACEQLDALLGEHSRRRRTELPGNLTRRELAVARWAIEHGIVRVM
jgi:hypothetical protein